MATSEQSTFLSRYFSIINATYSLLIISILMSWIPSAHCCMKIVERPKYPGQVVIVSPRILSSDTNTTMAVLAHNSTANDLLEIEAIAFKGGGKVSLPLIPLKNDVPIFFNVSVNSNDFMTEDRYGATLVSGNIGTNFSGVISGIYIVDFYKKYVFLQTDKSIYHPNEIVQIRVIPLNDQLRPENITIRIEIKNPQNISMYKTTFLQPWKTSLSDQFLKLNFSISTSPMLGKWTVYAFHGNNYRQNFSVKFEVKQYVSPIFRVKLKVPDVFLSSDKEINIKVLAKYAYGKKVNGVATCKLNIVNDSGEVKVGVYNKKIKEGEATFPFSLVEILQRASINNFPEGSQLSIKCSVIDAATGIEEKATEEDVPLAKSPYLISFNEPLKYFKLGVTSTLKVNVTYRNGKPAVDVPTTLNITDSHHKPLQFFKATTDKNGCIFYYFHLPTGRDAFIATVTTDDEAYTSEQQSSATHQFKKVLSENYIAISRYESRTIKIGEMFTAEVVTYPSNKYDNLYFAVLVRRRMLLLKSIPKVTGKSRKFNFAVTAEMFPVVRVVIFSVENKTLFVDSLGLQVENKCQIAVQTDFPNTEPGRSGKIILNGEPNAKVGLLATDISAFETINEDALTNEKIFEILANNDLATGPIDGINSKEILFNSGLIIFGNVDYEDTGGYDKPPWANLQYTKVSKENKKQDSYLSEEHSIPSEKEVKLRSEFRETWFFEDYKFSSNGSVVIDKNLPDSITTWVIQAVSVSPGGGICVSKPQEVNSLKDMFIKLNLPFSVVRNQRVDIEAIIINNQPKKIPVTVNINVVESLSTDVKVGEKTERIVIEAFSAGKIQFSFVPSKIQDYLIRVTALSTHSQDSVVKKLPVVFEGIIEEDNMEIVLDPTNQQKRQMTRIVTDSVSDFIDEIQHIQVTKINLQPRKQFLSGSEKFIITIIGNEFGLDFEIPQQNSQYLTKQRIDNYQRVLIYMDQAFYALNLLENKRNVSLEQREKLYDYLRRGYTQVLTLRNKYGYFSKSVNDSPSIWLTSFVAKMLCQASKYIFIDENVIYGGLNWIISKQNPEGSFDDDGAVKRNHLSGNASKILVTSLVLINLQECSPELKQLRTVLRRTKLFLERHYASLNDSYAMSTTSYALAITNSRKKYEANEKLQQMSVFDAELNHRYWKKESRLESIETTAYALLARLLLKNFSHSLPIVNWMKTQTLKEEMFLAAQVTTVARHALSQYQTKSNPNEVALVCNISSDNGKNLIKTTKILKDDRKQFEVKNDFGGTLYFHTSGKGVGGLSVKMKYYVWPEDQRCKFDMTVDLLEISSGWSDIWNQTRTEHKNVNHDGDMKGMKGRGAYSSLENNKNITLEVKICARFISNKNSKTTIIEVGLFSGYIPVKENLDNLLGDLKSPLDRYEINDRKIIFYLDHVTYDRPTCINFYKRRNYMIRKVQSSIIRIYEQHRKNDYCSKFYIPDTQ